MKKFACACLLALVLCAAARAGEPPRITGDEGATMPDLIREGRLVTITLTSGAQDFNVKITGIHEDSGTVSIVDSTGAPTAYRIEKIRDVRVQKGVIRRGEKPDPDTVLTAEDKSIVAGAANRAMAIFTESHVQPVKMVAANILAASDHEHKAGALSYLKELSETNDAATALAAAAFLWQNGEVVTDETLLAGFDSGSRGAKATASILAGLMKADQFVVELRKFSRDPSVEISPAATMALGRIGDEESVQGLIEALSSITEPRALAAVFSLGQFRSQDVTRRLEESLEQAEGLPRYRAISALYLQGNERARNLLATEFMKEPAYDRFAALVLARDGDPDALKFLRGFLEKPFDPNAENLIFRASAAMALYIAGDIQAKGIVTDVLNTRPGDIYAAGKTGDQKFKEASVNTVQRAVCALMGNTMRRDMLPVLAGPIQSTDPTVALTACLAAMQIGNREFGKRAKDFLAN